MKTGYVIRLRDPRLTYKYAYGSSFWKARVFKTRREARLNKRAFGVTDCSRLEEILQVELSWNDTPKRIIKKTR